MTAVEWIESGEWTGIVSSNVLAAVYDRTGFVLTIQYQGVAKGVKQPKYDYFPVHEETARQFFEATSKGSFRHRVLHAGAYNVTGPY